MSAKSARAATGRYIGQGHDDPTEAPQKVASKYHSTPASFTTARTTPPPLPSSVTAYYVSAQSSPLSNLPTATRATNGNSLDSSTPSAGRPPTKISLEPNGTLHQTTNGVVTEIKLVDDNVEALADASAAAFDSAIVKQTNTAPKGKDKRVLRSQGGSSRSKSSLARFFPDFEEVVFGLAREPELLTVDSTLFIVDKKLSKHLDDRRSKSHSPAVDRPDSKVHEPLTHNNKVPIFAHNTHTQILNEWPKVDAVTLQMESDTYETDPLSDAVYLKAHKRGERKEKQLRNIEKEHALHEKFDLEKLLAELKGPDWLKAMGISGITESEKKAFEPHRDLYVMRVKALLNKFSAWKEQEKELKIRREEALAAREEAEEEEAEEEDGSHDNPMHLETSAQQVMLDATSATRTKPKIKLKLSKYVVLEPEPERVFESFYSKPHLRAAALGSHRRGRTVTAFGLPLPEMEIKDFALPGDFITKEEIIANARKRRRLKRESNVSEVQ